MRICFASYGYYNAIVQVLPRAKPSNWRFNEAGDVCPAGICSPPVLRCCTPTCGSGGHLLPRYNSTPLLIHRISMNILCNSVVNLYMFILFTLERNFQRSLTVTSRPLTLSRQRRLYLHPAISRGSIFLPPCPFPCKAWGDWLLAVLLSL